MARTILRPGDRYGRVVVLGCSCHRRRTLAVCDCGTFFEPFKSNLVQGFTKSCGCLRQEVSSARVTHGLSETPIHETWMAMRRRCNDKNNPHYPQYGGRGIAVCARWEKFENFLSDMGPRPSGMSIDRVDVNGGYEPSNCRWADASTQVRNRRGSCRWRIGELVFETQKEAAAHFGLSQSRISQLVSSPGSAWVAEKVYP